jgi:Ribbon-helix-helix domain
VGSNPTLSAELGDPECACIHARRRGSRLEVSRDTDIAVRTFLARRGMKKGDLTKFVEEAVRWRVFDQTVSETKAKNAAVPAEEIEADIEEALTAVCAERFGPRKA